MKISYQKFTVGLSIALLIASNIKSSAFALLGPVQPWMFTNNVVNPDDIGGPLSLGSEYRWNVPVLTYGFDKSFLDYFGINGVTAVSNAIQILNNLPPASQLESTNYPFASQNINYAAQSEHLLDLKSQTLFLLLEHLGLTSPKRSIYVLRQWNPAITNEATTNAEGLLGAVFEGTNLANYVFPQNYDPQTLAATPYLNNILYSGTPIADGEQFAIEPFSVDPLVDGYSTVADNSLGEGGYYNGLTYDDVGGLAYLLATNNVHFETLLPNIFGVGTNANSFVNGAWRPGVDKITFIPQPVDLTSGAFLPATNYYTDSYFTNGILHSQQMARINSQPDFIFSAGDVTSSVAEVPLFTRTGTTNWLNNAAANGNTNGIGPGIIQSPVQITFNKLGPQWNNYGDPDWNWNPSEFWASFDGTTNPPSTYPIPQTGTIPLTIRLWLTSNENISTSFAWQASSLPGAVFVLQTSTNLVNWTNAFPVTNNNSSATYFNFPLNPSEFFRVVPQ